MIIEFCELLTARTSECTRAFETRDQIINHFDRYERYRVHLSPSRFIFKIIDPLTLFGTKAVIPKDIRQVGLPILFLSWQSKLQSLLE